MHTYRQITNARKIKFEKEKKEKVIFLREREEREKRAREEKGERRESERGERE